MSSAYRNRSNLFVILTTVVIIVNISLVSGNYNVSTPEPLYKSYCETEAFFSPLKRPDDILCHETNFEKVGRWTNRAVCNYLKLKEQATTKQLWYSVCVFPVENNVDNLIENFDCVVTSEFGPVLCTEKNGCYQFVSNCSYTIYYCTESTDCAHKAFDDLYAEGGTCHKTLNCAEQNLYMLTRYLYDVILPGGKHYDDLRHIINRYPLSCYSGNIAIGCVTPIVLFGLLCLLMKLRDVLRKDLRAVSSDERLRDLERLLHVLPEQREYCGPGLPEEYICISEFSGYVVTPNPPDRQGRRFPSLNESVDGSVFLSTSFDIGSGFSELSPMSPHSPDTSSQSRAHLTNEGMNARVNFYVHSGRNEIAYNNVLYNPSANEDEMPTSCCAKLQAGAPEYVNEHVNGGIQIDNLRYFHTAEHLNYAVLSPISSSSEESIDNGSNDRAPRIETEIPNMEICSREDELSFTNSNPS